MKKSVRTKANEAVQEHKRKKRWAPIAGILCTAAAACTAYVLINPAVTANQKAFCGYEEHTAHTEECYAETKTLTCTLEETDGHAHTDSCYEAETVLTCTLEETDGHSHTGECYNEVRTLVCGNEDPEHEHTGECYEVTYELVCGREEVPAHHHTESCYETRQVLACGKEETPAHQHTEECYSVTKELVCDKPLHEHTLQCYSDPEADVENAAVWQKTLSGADLTGKWSEDVLAIAKTQLGYTESTANYEVQPDGMSMKGYTRYGQWYGIPYGDWCAMYCSFCLDYAGVKDFPQNANCRAWIKALSDKDCDRYHMADAYTPKPGDLIFFDWEAEPAAEAEDAETLPENEGRILTAEEFERIVSGVDHVGLVLEVIPGKNGDAGQVKTIEGNSGDKVAMRTYELDDARIIGYGDLPANPDYTEMMQIEAQAEDEAVITISGMLPEDAEVRMEPVPFGEDDLAGMFGTETASQITSYAAYDITIISCGEAWQPDESVGVTIKNPDMDAESGNSFAVAHISDTDGTIDNIEDAELDKHNDVTFSAESFSTYLLYSYEAETLDSGQMLPLRAVGSTPGSVTEPSYPAYLPVTGEMNGDTSLNGVAGEYWSDPATSQLESLFTGTSDDDGKVLTDKTVIYGKDDYNAFQSYDANTFGVELSALGQAYPLSSEFDVQPPLDVVFILDCSGSMTDNKSNGRYVANIAVDALNEGIAAVLNASPDNRVGLACYSGIAQEVLPLDRYTANDVDGDTIPEYLTEGNDTATNPKGRYGSYSARNTDLTTAASLKNSQNQTYSGAWTDFWGGTYTQAGIAMGSKIFDDADRSPVTRTVTREIDGRQVTATYTVSRQPVFVLISDGEPTYCTNSYTDVLNATRYGTGSAGYNVNHNRYLRWETPISKTNTNNQGVQGFYTILSANYYKQHVTGLYNKDASFCTIGIGINESGNDTNSISTSGDDYKRAVLNPSTGNITHLANCTAGRCNGIVPDNDPNVSYIDDNYRDISGFTQYTCRELYQLLNSSFNDNSVTLDVHQAYSGVDAHNGGTVPTMANPYSTNYNYVDTAQFISNTSVDAIVDAISGAVETVQQNVSVYGFILRNNTPLEVTDTIGDGMELKSEPVLRYGGENHLPVSHETAGNVTTYHYSGTYTATDGSGRTADLSKITATVTMADGKQTVTMHVPDDVLPTYTPELANNGDVLFYYESLPVRLIYQVGLTEESEAAVSALQGTVNSLTYYTNAWQGNDDANSEYQPSQSNPYFKDDDYSKSPLEKNPNETGTDVNAWEYDPVSNGAYVRQHLGNNGKLTFTPGIEATLRKVDINGEPVTTDTAEFKVYRDAEGQHPIGTYTTDDTGMLTIPSLQPGRTYYLEETRAPSGYKPISGLQPFTVNSDGTVSVTATAYFTAAADDVITVKNDFGTVTVNVEKLWEGAGEGEAYPASAEVTLYADGEPYGDPQTLNASNNWHVSWNDLQAIDRTDRHLIAYTVVETPVDGYAAMQETREDGTVVITNRKIGTTSLSVLKKWDGGTENSVQVELLKNGQTTGMYATLNAGNGWYKMWDDLPDYDENGRITYSVREIAIEGYSTDIHLWTGPGDPYGQTGSEIRTLKTSIQNNGVYLLTFYDDELDDGSYSALMSNADKNGLEKVLYTADTPVNDRMLWRASVSGSNITFTNVFANKQLVLNNSNRIALGTSGHATTWQFVNLTLNNGKVGNTLRASYNRNYYFFSISSISNGTGAAATNYVIFVYPYLYENTVVEDSVVKGDTHYIIRNTKQQQVPGRLSLTFTKVNSETDAPLPGAEFILYRETGIPTDDLIPGTADRHGVPYAENEADSKWTSGDSAYTVTNLQNGTYYLVELTPPAGFEPLEKPVVFDVSSDDTGRKATVVYHPATETGTEFTAMDIPNTPSDEYELPESGGPGTNVLYASGALLTAGAAGIMAFRKRKKDAENEA